MLRSACFAKMGLKVELVFQWTEATDEFVKSYVNGIPYGIGRNP